MAGFIMLFDIMNKGLIWQFDINNDINCYFRDFNIKESSRLMYA